jgi:uncharacterized protein (UPF0548 family)
MALWRFGRGWSDPEMRGYLDALRDRPVNFDDPPEAMTAANGWIIDGDSTVVGNEPEGPPVADGFYERARQAIVNYDFSDPAIVVAHFDPEAPLAGRDMLLELKVLGLHYLCGCRVTGVREEEENGVTMFGFRYDTLEGHIERGFEWFLLSKDQATGEIDFRIEAHWKPGTFPNWWSRVGFLTVGRSMRSLWRHRAPDRIRELAHKAATAPVAAPGELAHRGDSTPARTDPPTGL